MDTKSGSEIKRKVDFRIGISIPLDFKSIKLKDFKISKRLLNDIATKTISFFKKRG